MMSNAKFNRKTKAIYRLLGSEKDGSRKYAKICRLQLRPLERLHEENAPEKAIFCKPLRPTTVQTLDENIQPKYQNGKPVTIETVICPIPADCVKPEMEILPSMRIMPDVDQTTAHAGSKGPAIVHIEPKPFAP